MARKVLVVDDEPLFCEVLSKFLAGKGYQVVVSTSGDGALVAYRQEKPNVVLLDVRMPGKDSLEILRELKVFDPEARVIMLAAIHDNELAKQALAEGALEYITKPVSLDYLDVALIAAIELLGGDE